MIILLIMLWCGGSLFSFCQFQHLQSLSKTLWIPPSKPTTIRIITTLIFHRFSVLGQSSSVCLSSRFSFIFILQSTRYCRFSYLCLLSRELVFWPTLGDLLVSLSSRKLGASYSPGQILVYACLFWLYG